MKISIRGCRVEDIQELEQLIEFLGNGPQGEVTARLWQTLWNCLWDLRAKAPGEVDNGRGRKTES